MVLEAGIPVANGVADFQKQSRNIRLQSGKLDIHPSETFVLRRESFVNRTAHRVEPLAECVKALIHRLAKCAKALVHRLAQNVQALVHCLAKGIRALVQLTPEPVEGLVQHVEAFAQRIEPLAHRLTKRVKFPIEPCVPDCQSASKFDP